jgi:hypothetical protein
LSLFVLVLSKTGDDMLLVRAEDTRRLRVVEIKKWINAHSKEPHRTRGGKAELVQRMREMQARRAIARHPGFAERVRARVRARSALRIQRWWRAARRFIPINPHDPITLNEWADIRAVEGRCFSLVKEDGSVYRYEADSLFLMLHQASSPVEPLCRHSLSSAELLRLDGRVSAIHLRAHGSCVSIGGDAGSRRRRRRKVVLELASCLEDTLDTLCLAMNNTMQVAYVTGPENRARLAMHISSTQTEFITTFSQLCAVDCAEAVSYGTSLRKDQFRSMALAGVDERVWYQKTLGVLDFCLAHSSHFAQRRVEVVVREAE